MDRDDKSKNAGDRTGDRTGDKTGDKAGRTGEEDKREGTPGSGQPGQAGQ